MAFVSGNANVSDADQHVRLKQIEQMAGELAVVLRSNNTAMGEALARVVEGVAKAACGE